jgi:PKD repeat protein
VSLTVSSSYGGDTDTKLDYVNVLAPYQIESGDLVIGAERSPARM